jgi:hypothetical protein
MQKTSSPNLINLLISTICAVALAAVLIKSGSTVVTAVLSTFVTVLCLQIAFLRREISVLKDQISSGNRT